MTYEEAMDLLIRAVEYAGDDPKDYVALNHILRTPMSATGVREVSHLCSQSIIGGGAYASRVCKCINEQGLADYVLSLHPCIQTEITTVIYRLPDDMGQVDPEVFI